MRLNKSSENYLYVRTIQEAESGLEEWMARVKGDGLYFGAECCEHLIPTPRELMAFCNRIGNKGWRMYLMTGSAPASVLGPYRALMECFAGLPRAVGVVFNDWGILSLLRRDFPSLEPVMGRLLFKNMRFVNRTIRPAGGFSASQGRVILRNQIKAIRQTSFSISAYRQFLRSWGVVKVDVDILPQGIDLTGCDLSVGAYTPWGYLTSGRTCPLWEQGRRYPTTDGCQTRPCLAGGKILPDERGEFRMRLLERGNAVFYEVPAGKAQGVNRWIHEIRS